MTTPTSRPGDAPVDLVALDEHARSLLGRAHAPYSQFPVAAVVVTAAGNHHEGVNVENAAYGATICAERMAVGAMVAAGDESGIVTVVVAGRGPEPLSPCGTCRQVLAEFSHPGTVVHGRGDDGASRDWTVEELLPAAFGPLRLAAGVEAVGTGSDQLSTSTPETAASRIDLDRRDHGRG